MGRHAHRAASPSPRWRLTAREMEAQAAAAQAVAPAPLLPSGEAMAMLARRGFRPEVGRPDLPFARELRRRLGCDVATGVKFRAPGLGGDLDVVAAMEGKLIYLELKSSPPKHLTQGEVAAFFARVRRLRPDVAVFAVDTALRLADRVLPLL